MDKDSHNDLKVRREELDIEVLMSTDNGRRFVWKLLAYCGVYQDLNFEEPYNAAKQAGKRQVGLYLLGIISDNNEEMVFKMMKEAKNASFEEEKYYDTRERNTEGKSIDTTVGDNDSPFGIPTGTFPEGRNTELGTFI